MDQLKNLKLLHLADSALAIGNTAHSFGLETLANDGLLTATSLLTFFQNYLSENGQLEGFFCRSAFRLTETYEQEKDSVHFLEGWQKMNAQLSAFKIGREGREASITLGRRFLQLALNLEHLPVLELVAQATPDVKGVEHHCIAFGLVGSALGIDEEATVLAFSHQALSGLVSACQRLLPVGQSQANWLLWQLKPYLIEVAAQSKSRDLTLNDISCTMPMLELAVMRHPGLTTRLFIS